MIIKQVYRVPMVDTEDPQLAAKTLDTIQTFTSAHIKIVVNSHIHPDHTGGNAFFAKQGAVIFSQENLRDEMVSPPGQGNARAPIPMAFRLLRIGTAHQALLPSRSI
jgi:glyoxylase-like metal-dependent hydrolase (beta-lactamase superfamily II)